MKKRKAPPDEEERTDGVELGKGSRQHKEPCGLCRDTNAAEQQAEVTSTKGHVATYAEAEAHSQSQAHTEGDDALSNNRTNISDQPRTNPHPNTLPLFAEDHCRGHHSEETTCIFCVRARTLRDRG